MINYSIHADEKMDLLDITASEVEMVLLEGEEIIVKCMYCKNGDLKDDYITRSYEKDGVVTVITGVPVKICEICGHEYLDHETVKKLEIIRKKSRMPGLSMAVFNYSTSIHHETNEPIPIHE